MTLLQVSPISLMKFHTPSPTKDFARVASSHVLFSSLQFSSVQSHIESLCECMYRVWIGESSIRLIRFSLSVPVQSPKSKVQRPESPSPSQSQSQSQQVSQISSPRSVQARPVYQYQSSPTLLDVYLYINLLLGVRALSPTNRVVVP
jgi:hypothetical protein